MNGRKQPDLRRCGAQDSGYNADRFLLVKGYNTNIDKTVDDRFVMPTDTAKNRLFVGVHYYEPGAMRRCRRSKLWEPWPRLRKCTAPLK